MEGFPSGREDRGLLLVLLALQRCLLGECLLPLLLVFRSECVFGDIEFLASV